MNAICKQCQQTYTPFPVPKVPEREPQFDSPAYCYECSNQRRLSWLNHYSLYNRLCNQCGEDTIGMYQPNSDYQVYCAKCWQNRTCVSQPYDQQQTFFAQFSALLKRQPLPALLNDNNQLSINCAYTNNLSASKNCYFIFDGHQDEDCYYSYSIGESRNSADCSYCIDAELCYELINCHGCYRSAYLIDSRLATNCYFCYDLSNCTDCLFSSGLRNKQYYIFNQPYSKEQYETYVQSKVNRSNYRQWQDLITQYQQWLNKVVRKESTNRKNENCRGNDVLYCKNSFGFFIHTCEDCENVFNSGSNSKNITSCIHASASEICSECIGIEHAYTTFASAFCTHAQANFYSLYCKNCKNVFGCIGLQNQEYCILNKQYSPEEYEQITKQIIIQMQADQSFGQFFPPALSPFEYHETIAQDLFPVTQGEAQARGYRWSEQQLSKTASQASPISDDINDVDTTITKTTLTCETCSKKYRITEQELALYKDIQVPLPHQCFRCRHRARCRRRPNFHVYQRNCSHCQNLIETHYAVSDAEQVYCHACYEQYVLIN